MTDLFEPVQEKDYFAELVGDGKKFKSPQDLAKGKYEADLYIENLTRQKDELRSDYLKLREESQARATLQELIDKLSKPQEQQQVAPTQAKESERPTFDLQQLESLVQSKLREHDVSKTKDQNFNQVVGELKQRFGDNYVELLNKQTEELGLTKEMVNSLAQTAPKAFFKTLGLESKPQEGFTTPPRQSALFSPKGEQKRTWSYYNSLRKDNPTLYFSPKMQVQMHKDYETLGTDFEDGDFLTMGQSSIRNL